MRQVKVFEHKRMVDEYERQYIGQGTFHAWGNDYEELRDGIANFSVAIVEMRDGKVKLISPQNIEFIKKED